MRLKSRRLARFRAEPLVVRIIPAHFCTPGPPVGELCARALVRMIQTNLGLDLLRRLAAVFAQRQANGLFHAGIDRRRATQISLPFVGHARLQVAGAGRAMFGLALSGQAKSLLRAFVSFLFGHHYYLRHNSGKRGNGPL